jgi:hypothetical protein
MAIRPIQLLADLEKPLTRRVISVHDGSFSLCPFLLASSCLMYTSPRPVPFFMTTVGSCNRPLYC